MCIYVKILNFMYGKIDLTSCCTVPRVLRTILATFIVVETA